MRDRLMAVLVGMTIAMIALYGIPRAYLLADLVNTQEQRKIERSADLLAVLVPERLAAGSAVDEQFLSSLLNEGETLAYVSGDGSTVRAGPAPAEEDLVERRTLAGGGSLTLSRSYDLVQSRISEALLPLVVIGLGLTAFAALVGFWLARRLSRPFAELAGAAERLSRARFDLELPHYDMREAEAIGAALRRASVQLDELLRREREFASNASHQLRTPITALRLTLEDLTMWPQTPPEVARELTDGMSELDRLSGAITELLELSRGRRLGEPVDVDLTVMLHDVVERWSPTTEEEGRTVSVETSRPVPAHLVPGPVLQILDVLVENACAYGTGHISLRAHEEQGKYLHVTVADEGVRGFGPEVFERGVRGPGSQGHGLGLPIAVELATSLGGFLSLADLPTTAFVLVLPAPDRHDAAGGVDGDDGMVGAASS